MSVSTGGPRAVPCPHRVVRDAVRPGHNVPVTSYRVMTVCTGNICRSPMAEVVLRERLEQAGLDGLVEVDSTGVSDEEHGSPIDPRARATLVAHGYPVPAHRARRVTRDELAERDLVLAMTAGHVRALRRIGGDAPDVRMLRSFDPQAPTAPRTTCSTSTTPGTARRRRSSAPLRRSRPRPTASSPTSGPSSATG